jgi:hypothetical protein
MFMGTMAMGRLGAGTFSVLMPASQLQFFCDLPDFLLHPAAHDDE